MTTLSSLVATPEIRVNILGYLDPSLLKEQVIASLSKGFLLEIVTGRKLALPQFLSGMITYLKKADDGNYPTEIAALEQLRRDVLCTENQFNVSNFRDATNRFNASLLPLLDTIPLETLQKSVNLVAYSFLPYHITRFVYFNYLINKRFNSIVPSYGSYIEELVKLGEFNRVFKSIANNKIDNCLEHLICVLRNPIVFETKHQIDGVIIPADDSKIKDGLFQKESIQIKLRKLIDDLINICNEESIQMFSLSFELRNVSKDRVSGEIERIIKRDKLLVNEMLFKKIVSESFPRKFQSLIKNGKFIEAYKKAASENCCAKIARKYLTLEQMRYIKKRDGYEAALSFVIKKGEDINGPIDKSDSGMQETVLVAYEELCEARALHLLTVENKNIEEIYDELVNVIPHRFDATSLILAKVALRLVYSGKIEEAVYLFARLRGNISESKMEAFEYLFFKSKENIEHANKFLF